MKSLRRSFNKEPPPISTPISTFPAALSKPLSFQQPPKKVIRCVRPFRGQSPQELSCSVGEFLYVVREVEAPDGGWYEVTNPTNNSRGIVPKSCFEELPKSAPGSIQAGPNARLPPNMNRASSALRPPGSKHQTFYAIVQYDFSAERPDELDAKAGEPISVVAQSNREWFVAKPIGRLGGPGLIPVSFVEIRDPVTNLPVRDVDALMDQGVLPRVEEWKQATAEYKASSIPLGVLDELSVGEGVKDSPFMRQSQWQPGQPQPPQDTYASPPQQYNTRGPLPAQPPQHERSQSQAQTLASQSRAVSHAEPEPPQQNADGSDMLPLGNILSASIPSFHYENDEYWFRIDAIYQANPTASGPSKNLQLVLYRNYDDFYDFQISLLDAFPVEAGRRPPDHLDDNGYPTPPASEEGANRILPYMPGPVSYVDDMITSVRRTELDQYLAELVELSERGAGHVLQHDLVRSFLSPKSGDVVDEVDALPPPPAPPAPSWPNNATITAATPVDEEPEDFGDQYGDAYGQEAEDDVAQHMQKMSLKPSSSSGGAAHGRSSSGSYDAHGGKPAGPSRTSNYRTSEYDRTSGRYSGAEYGRATPSGQSGQSGRRSRGPSPQKNVPRTHVEEADSRPQSYADRHGGPAGGGNQHSDRYSNHSGGHNHSYSYSSATGASNLSPPLNQGPGGAHPQNGGSRSARSSGGITNDGPYSGSPNPSSSRASQPDGGGNGPAPAFLKIKIFHSESDDLIAIRVPPKVTYQQLITKVRDRLGDAVTVLRYRDSFDGGAGSKSWREIEGDTDLRQWIAKGDKLVLYAD